MSLALLVCGILLFVLGINAYLSTNSDVARFFASSSADRSTWLLIGAVVTTVLGLTGLVRWSMTR